MVIGNSYNLLNCPPFKAEDDGLILRCEYASNAFTDEIINDGKHFATVNISVRGKLINTDFGSVS